MELKYFNKWEFQKALDFANTDPLMAKLKFEKYLEKYPKDYSAYAYYIHILIILGEFETAEKILDFVEKQVILDKSFNKDANKIGHLTQNFLFSRFKILMYQQKYNEVCRLFANDSEKLGNITLNAVIFFCKSKLGKLDHEKRDINAYLFRQIVEYKKSDFIEHIKKHLTDYNFDVDNRNESVFMASFPINEVLQEVEKYIPSSNALYPGFFENVYVFKYNGCGRDNYKIVDYFKVVTFHGTQNMITVFPSDHCQNLPHVDLNYLVPDDKNVKEKKLSQIEKFNQKYRNN